MKATIQRSGHKGTQLSPRLSLLALALIISQSGMAQSAMTADTGWYGGVSAGESQADINDDAIVARSLNQGFTTSSLTKFEDDVGYKLFLGYQINRNLAIETGYFTLGEFRYMTELDPVATRRGDVRGMGLNIDLVGFLPLGDRFSLLGRIGSTYAQTRAQYSGYGVNLDRFQSREREMSYKFGVGFQYELSDNLAMRVEAERYRMDGAIPADEDVDLYSVGVVYRFGAKAAPPPPAQARVVAPAPAPAPRATPPPPAPTPAPPPQPTLVSFSADSLFDFNSSTVNRVGMQELDRLAADLRDVDFDRIEVVGHTDRIGSQADNQRLSNARAAAVKDYIVRSANIAASRVSTRGVGSSEPMTTLAQCSNDMPRAQLIVCLAPDRRVEVEVSGTRTNP